MGDYMYPMGYEPMEFHMGYGYYYMYPWMLWTVFFIWIIQVIVGYFVYRDAKQQDMNPVLWFILVILPMIGWFFLIVYVIIRETRPREPGDKESSEKILDERFAKGEITSEQYRQMKEELKK